MFSLPSLQIHQQYAKIGMDSAPARLDIHQPKADMAFHTTPARLNIRQPHGELHVDNSKTWDALGKGGALHVRKRVYAGFRNDFLQGLAQTMEDGDRMADITNPNNAFAEIARDRFFRSWPMDAVGYASSGNIAMEYVAHPPEMEYVPGRTDTRIWARPPEMEYHPGQVNIYMQQYASVTITSQIDIRA